MSHRLDRGPARSDVLQSLTGLFLVLFIWAHMIFESSILLGMDAMYKVTRMFEGVHLFDTPRPGLVSAAAAIIFILIAAHAILALRKFPGSYRQYREFNSHRVAMRHTDTTLWYVQVLTGFALFFLASAHLVVVFLQPDNIGPYASSDRVWSGRFWIIYAPLLLCVHLHAGIGMYRLAMKWAPIPAKGAQKTRRRLKLAMWGVIFFFLCLGTASLVTYMQIGRDHAAHAGERYVPPDSPVSTGAR